MSFIREPDAEPIAGYRLVEPLGSGGFGEVWKCIAPGGLFKAIKFVFGNLNALDMEGARAEQELHALERVKEIRHPFVLSMDRIEVTEGELVIVMELADKSLHDALVEAQQAGLVGLPRDALMRYMRDAAEALDHMNEKYNLQHLDIKPRNLFLVSDRCKVADFGLVKHLERATASGILGGVTPLYAPPETFTGKIYATTDQYSLAIVYQELLTGQRPFTGKNARVLAQQHMQADPDLRTLPEAERPVVARALSKDASKRFPNCLAFVRALYTARSPSRAEIVIPGPTNPDAVGQRPKSIIDTLDNISLEQMEDEGGWVALDEPPPDDGLQEVSQLGVTVAQPNTGALRPTIVIGLGAFGKRALLELRCRLIDRFGSLDQLPMLRFLYIDPDPDAIRNSTRGSSEVVFRTSEVHHLPLQPVAHYRRRQMEQLNDWLPREKLYALPRSLKTQSSRALGRLAFADNYQRLLTRLRREIQQATHPDAIYQSVSQTGLALRDNVPRVYVIAAAAGGASGFLVDLGYALRRLLHQLRHADSPVTALVFAGAPGDPATPKTELANIHATLTEINHFSDPSIPFIAQYSADGQRIQDHGPPFDGAYLMPLANRTPEAVQATVAHLGSYLFHEMTTPLGLRLEQLRRFDAAQPPPTPFRSMGTYAVWFPRGLLLRLAARSACNRLLDDWMAGGGQDRETRRPGERSELLPTIPPIKLSEEGEAACARALADPGLRPESLSATIEELCRTVLEGTPAEALTRLLTTLEDQSMQSVALDDPANWARQTVTRVREWLGPGLSSGGGVREAGEWRRSKLTRALEAAADRLAQEWNVRLHEVSIKVMEAPGQRVAAAEAAMNRLLASTEETANCQAERRNQVSSRVQIAQSQLQTALDACSQAAGGFSLFGMGSTRRRTRVFLDHLAAYARQCLAEDLSSAVHLFQTNLATRLRDRLRDLSFCRQRLRHLQEQLTLPEAVIDETAGTPSMESSPTPTPAPSAESFWEAIRQSETTRVVLPLGETELERAAHRFLATVNSELWRELDLALQERVLGPAGGLHHALAGCSDLTRNLVMPLLEHASAFLGEQLPATDVAQVLVEQSDGPLHHSLKEQVKDFFASAVPLVDASSGQVQTSRPLSRVGIPTMAAISDPDFAGSQWGREKARPMKEQAFLLVPASEAGKTYSEQARQAFPQFQVVRVPGQSALMVCREKDWLNLEPLSQVLAPCRRAYEELILTPPTSPHSRSDISDWIPLE